MFSEIPQHASFPDQELEILDFWKEKGIYAKSLEQRTEAEKFVFYEGPPTANGLPHPGHCLTRAIKDLFPRYRTMRGYLCERKAGWDTHGLPVEVEVCKELGIHSKEEIEDYGVEPFIHKCQESVWRYMQEWERLTERLGFWIRLDQAYVTYHQSYVESVWWSLKTLFDRGLLYQGHKIVWWWAQGGTALSSGEVGQGYRKVADPSVYVRFPLLDDYGNETSSSLLVWTTTPWTLPSNQFVAVHPDLEYAYVTDDESGETLILAKDLYSTIAEKSKRSLTEQSTCRGESLVGLRYRPPFDYYYSRSGNDEGTLTSGQTQHLAWRIVAADFVTTDSGTGFVHQAPAFGEVDYEVLLAEQDRFEKGQGPELICAVGPDGKFTSDAPDYQGRWVKEADKDISRDMRERGVLFHLDQYLHDYPFCWRAEDDPLIQYPRQSWFIRTTRFKDRMLANNQQVNWLPDHIKNGRFGNFLETNVDWALSRERYWGTPLPIWVCEETGSQEAISSYKELLAKPGVRGTDVWEKAKQSKPELSEDLKVHKPYIDSVTYDSPFASGARMRRVSEVIDCWFDSGAMPFAQWGYPHQGRPAFEPNFPADFISEAIDQTRGWFYSLLAISTLLFPEENGDTTDVAKPLPHPYRNCIVLGLMLGEDGAKMSKSKRNYREPQEIFDRYGADALRWYFFANQAPWTSIRYSERAIRESIPEFLLRLWNVFSFFVTYGRIDGFDPASELGQDLGQLNTDRLAQAKSYRPVAERGELDRWVLSELNRTLQSVVRQMDLYNAYDACGDISAFVDGLSNWFVRRSRDRFWSSEKESIEKRDAYWTLYECLLTTSKMIAPFVPFLAERMWQNLTGVFAKAPESVHLCDYPTGGSQVIDNELSERMQLVRRISSLGRSVRMNEKLKVRQPLAKVEVILAEETHRQWLVSHADLISDELNVKQVDFTQEVEKYITYKVKPNFKRLGPRVGKQMPQVKKALGTVDAAALLADLESQGKSDIRLVDDSVVSLDTQDIEIDIEAKPGWAAAQEAGCVVVLSTELTEELVREGYARDMVRLINDRRKELDCNYTDRVHLGIVTESDVVRLAINENIDYLRAETLAVDLTFEPLNDVEAALLQIADHEVLLYLKVV